MTVVWLALGALVLGLVVALTVNERRWDTRIRRHRRRQAKDEVRAAAKSRRWW